MFNTLNLYGPINNLGYGIFTRGIIKGLTNSGVFNFSISPIGGTQAPEDPEEGHVIKSIIESMEWERKAPSLAIWHEFDLNKFSGNKLIAYPIFETTKLMDKAKSQLKQMDSIFVTSNWAKSIITQNIGNEVPVFVIPGASDVVELDDNSTCEKNKNAFTFVNVGKFEKRKGHIELLRAYKEAFSNQNDSRLILHCFNPHIKNFEQSIMQMLTHIGYKVQIHSTDSSCIIASSGNAIVSIPRRPLTKKGLFNLYKYSHVGIFPSRAEGWNLPLMEAIKMGVPCIATNYSAHTEYLNEDTKYPQKLLLNDFFMEKAVDNTYFRGDRGDWASLSIENIASKMLDIYLDYENIQKEFSEAQKIIKDKFTWENSANKILTTLENI